MLKDTGFLGDKSEVLKTDFPKKQLQYDHSLKWWCEYDYLFELCK
jgi:hypothetical protein